MTLLNQPEITFPDVLRHNADSYSRATAVVCGDESLTWSEFGERLNKVANALRSQGLERGDRVVLVMENSLRALELLWGTVVAGGVIAPLNVMMSRDALPTTINNAEPKFVFVDAATEEAVDRIRGQLSPACRYYSTSETQREGWEDGLSFVDEASSDDVAERPSHSDSMSIIYSSGTTGAPKGIEHSHFARHMYPFGCGPMVKIDRHAVTLCCTPLYTNGTWINMLPTLFMGGTVVLMEKFSPEGFLQAVDRESVTHVFLVPTQIVLILDCPSLANYSLDSLRVILSGGAPLASKTLNELTARLPSAGLFEIYGITEGFITIATPEDRREHPGTVGKPVFGGDVRVIDPMGDELPRGDVGELTGWSAGLMKGYFRDEKRTREMIWVGPYGRTYLRSGDLGRIDEDGYIYVSGRLKDMIITGGINVFAADIEDAFMKHPDVREVAVVGVPHPKWGETPLLFAILKDGATVSEQELADWGNARVGKYQRVQEVRFLKEFPRAAHNKVLKRQLREPFWDGRDEG